MPFAEGVVYGLVLMLVVGPSFFYLIRVSLKKGLLRASSFAFGIMVSDLLIISAILLGLSRFLENESYQTVASLLAGVVIMILGLRNLTARHQKEEGFLLQAEKEEESGFFKKLAQRIGVFTFFLKGLLINGLNPFTVVLWVTVLASVTARHEYTTADFSLFTAGLLSVIVTADILKAYFANRLSKLINPKTLQIIDKVLGIIFILLSIRFLFFGYEHYQSLKAFYP